MKKIKSFEGACKALKLNPKKLPVVSGIPKKHRDAIIAHFKLVIIAEALNEGWKPNWDDSNEYKYYPYFDMQPGFGFGYTYYGNWYASSYVGSRLCFKTREIAEYAGRKFRKLYKQYMLIEK